MYKKDYEVMILNRIDKNFDKIMPVAAVVSIGSAIAISISPISNWFAVADLVIGLAFILMYILRQTMNTAVKVLVTIIVPIILGVFTFMDGGFSSGTVTLMLISNSVAVLFLSRRDSMFVATASIFSLCGLWIWSTKFEIEQVELPSVAMWIIQILLVVLFIFIFQIAVYTIRNYLLENIEELEESVALTYNLAYYDQLTGLPNLNLFMEQMIQLISDGPQRGYFIMFSLKSLNVINSVYGIEMGDVVLVETARCLQVIKRKEEIIARVSGNEFLVWIEEKYWRELDKNFQRVIDAFFAEFEVEEVRNSIEHFICYTEFDSRLESVESAYQKVNLALTYAKQHDKVEMIAYDKRFEEGIRRTSNLRELLKEAINHKEIKLSYQKKVDAVTEEVVGVEALARWYTKAYGHIGPDEFVPMTEDMNLAKDFGQLIVEMVLKDYILLCEKFSKVIKVSINISPTFLMWDGFIDYMTKAVESSIVRSDHIILEITEEIVIEGIEEVNHKLEILRAYGFLISLDDFGTGYSSLNYLSRLSVDEMKVDKVLVDNICDNERNSILLEAIIHLSKQYGLSLVAEGVETKAQRDKLVEVGCTTIQGYYYSKPEPL